MWTYSRGPTTKRRRRRLHRRAERRLRLATRSSGRRVGMRSIPLPMPCFGSGSSDLTLECCWRMLFSIMVNWSLIFLVQVWRTYSTSATEDSLLNSTHASGSNGR